MMYDNSNRANVWMIDFAKTSPVHDHILTHRDAWQLGNHEEGYLMGLDNLVDVSVSSGCWLGYICTYDNYH